MQRVRNDEFWYEQLLLQDSVSRPLNSSEKSSIINGSMQEAVKQKTNVEARFGRQSAETYIEKLGYQIEEEEPELMPSFLYMGMLEPDTKRIRLNQTVMAVLENYLKVHFAAEDERILYMRDIILFHELYHAIEECTEGIYTRNVKVERWRIGKILLGSKVEAASEIGAIHFSKLMTEVSFQPYLYTRYLLAATNQKMDENDE